MKKICILDTETTGLEIANNHIIEIAAILYDIELRTIICQANCLLPAPHNNAFEINKINPEILKSIPDKVEFHALHLIESILTEADAIVAHNAEFDKKWIEQINSLYSISIHKKWICTKNDVVWPIRKGSSLSLVNICVDLGVPILNTHRALDDCNLLRMAIEKNSDVLYFLDSSGIGRVNCIAHINYEQRQLAKDHGFIWDNVKKVWHAKMSVDELDKLPFKVSCT